MFWLSVPETTAIDDLRARLVPTGWVVTTDALFKQADIAQTICDVAGLPRGDVDARWTDRAADTLGVHRVVSGYVDWPGFAQALCVQRRITHEATGKTHTERAYAITSLASTAAAPAQLLVLWREHGHIENRLHFMRDVTFDEDRSTVRAGDIPQVIAALRSTAIGVARLHGATNVAAACRRYAAQPARALTAIGLLDFE